MDKISVIVPCFNEEAAIPKYYQAMQEVWAELQEVQYEMLFIDDGSTDETLALLRSLSMSDAHVQYLSFSRNFGKEAAMFAGLSRASGNYIVIMDVDLQHPPELVPKMYRMLVEEKGAIDCVGGKRVNRKGEGRIRNFLSRRFYQVANALASIRMTDGEGDYRMMSKRMVEALLSMQEYNRYSKGLFQFVGFESKWIPYENQPRSAGETKWSFFSLVRYAVDGILSFSAAPLAISSYFGVLFCFLSFLMGLYIAGKTLIFGNPTSGWTTLVCIILFGFGLQMFFIGLVGQYVSKNYMESKHRPLYFLKEESFLPVNAKTNLMKKNPVVHSCERLGIREKTHGMI